MKLNLINIWAYRADMYISPISIPVGREKVIEEAEGYGWILGVIAAFDNPDVKVTIEAYSPYMSVIKVDYSLRETFETRIIASTGFPAWCPRYDDINKIYVLAYSPSPPLAFAHKLKITLRPPKALKLKF